MAKRSERQQETPGNGKGDPADGTRMKVNDNCETLEGGRSDEGPGQEEGSASGWGYIAQKLGEKYCLEEEKYGRGLLERSC